MVFDLQYQWQVCCIRIISADRVKARSPCAALGIIAYDLGDAPGMDLEGLAQIEHRPGNNRSA